MPAGPSVKTVFGAFPIWTQVLKDSRADQGGCWEDFYSESNDRAIGET